MGEQGSEPRIQEGSEHGEVTVTGWYGPDDMLSFPMPPVSPHEPVPFRIADGSRWRRRYFEDFEAIVTTNDGGESGEYDFNLTLTSPVRMAREPWLDYLRRLPRELFTRPPAPPGQPPERGRAMSLDMSHTGAVCTTCGSWHPYGSACAGSAPASTDSRGSEAAQRAARKVSEELEERLRELASTLRRVEPKGMRLIHPGDCERAADALEAAREEAARMEAMSRDLDELLHPYRMQTPGTRPYEQEAKRLDAWLQTRPWARLRRLLGEEER